ncbi:MAG: hypothetical protein QOF51_688, partial [Chloroflexota bacterium]|nr:hypothetical protein [Chloroflexota bacterium]
MDQRTRIARAHLGNRSGRGRHGSGTRRLPAVLLATSLLTLITL